MIYPGIIGSTSPSQYSTNAFICGVNATTLITDTAATVVFRDNPVFPNGRDPGSNFDNTGNYFTAPSTTTVYMSFKFSLYNDSGTDSTATITLYDQTGATTITTLGTPTVTSASTSTSPVVYTTTYNLSATSGNVYEVRIRIGPGDTNSVYYLYNNQQPSCLWTGWWT